MCCTKRPRGRPVMSSSMRKRALTVMLDPDVILALERYADHGLRSHAINVTMREFLNLSSFADHR